MIAIETTSLRRACWALVTACSFVLAGIVPAQAQLTVTAMTVDGQPAQGVAGVQVRLPGAASVQAQALKVNEVIPAGSELTLPRGVRLALTSSNDNTITLHP